ncbi:MAG: hypothetical protein ACE5GH_02510 [Fidelibacterota bacterium]
MRRLLSHFLLALPIALSGSHFGMSLSTSDTGTVGVLPFDWSGQWGITHRYGFSGWGIDTEDGPLFLDGNFAHWPQRYAFPFKDGPLPEGGEEGIESSIWYRRGDYLLDEFAFDVDVRDARARTTRFQALKRNFDDRFGLLGPTAFLGAGGTIQQNYRLTVSIPSGKREEWRFGAAFYKTSDAIPVLSQGVWQKGAFRIDRILANGLSYTKRGDRVDVQLRASAFAQQLKVKGGVASPGWRADLLSYRVYERSDIAMGGTSHLFVEGAAKQSHVSSDTLGNDSRLTLWGLTGLKDERGGVEYHVGIGAGYVSPDDGALLYHGQVQYSRGATHLYGVLSRRLAAVPFQLSGRPFLHARDPLSGRPFPRIHPDSSAVSQIRSLRGVGAEWRLRRLRLQLEVFQSEAAPHFILERQEELELPDQISLTRTSRSAAIGVQWEGSANYFRNWWVGARGVSFPNNPEGWGNGIRHEVTLALRFQEFLFRRNLDARTRVWFDFWLGRNGFVWDPILSLGYYDPKNSYPRDATGVLNVEFKGIVSTFEISFTMLNVLYAGRDLLRTALGDTFSDKDLILTASPLFPSSGRLAFVTVRWKFKD